MEAILRRADQRAHDSDEEKLLIQQAQSGDRMAFEELIRRHDREILRLAFHMLGDREKAREVFQETFLKAFRSLNRFRFESSFYTWIYRIATNVGLDYLRKRQTLKEEISYESVFELRHYQGLRLKMIGEIMGSTEETAKNYLFRATQKLRSHLGAV
jgi:RNA polymerase sigma-70 factor (ECF subfamily)